MTKAGLSRVPGLARREAIQSVSAVRRAAAWPSEVSRRQLLALAADQSRIVDPNLRIELARALHAYQSAEVESALTLALLSLLDFNSKEDTVGLESLARDTAAMALLRSPDPLAQRALEARAREEEPTLARSAARKVLDRPPEPRLASVERPKPEPRGPAALDETRSTSALMEEFSAGRDDAARELARRSADEVACETEGCRVPYLAAVLAWLNDESEQIRLSTSEGLAMRLREAHGQPSSAWIVGALAERYRLEPSAGVRRSLIASLSGAPDSRARNSTLALASELDSDLMVRECARSAMRKGQKP